MIPTQRIIRILIIDFILSLFCRVNVIKGNNSIGELVYQGDNVTMGYAENCFDLQNGDENKGILGIAQGGDHQ